MIDLILFLFSWKTRMICADLVGVSYTVCEIISLHYILPIYIYDYNIYSDASQRNQLSPATAPQGTGASLNMVCRVNSMIIPITKISRHHDCLISIMGCSHTCKDGVYIEMGLIGVMNDKYSIKYQWRFIVLWFAVVILSVCNGSMSFICPYSSRLLHRHLGKSMIGAVLACARVTGNKDNKAQQCANNVHNIWYN